MSRSAAESALLLAALLGLAAAPGALARTEDRKAPMDIEADRSDAVLTDDGESRLQGNVRITQGSLDVRADSAVIMRRGGAIARVVLEGSPAVLRQVDDEGNPMQADARRIEYDLSGDVVVLTGDVVVAQSRGTLRGERITYDLGSGRVDAGGDGGRVRMTIQPKTGQDGG